MRLTGVVVGLVLASGCGGGARTHSPAYANASTPELRAAIARAEQAPTKDRNLALMRLALDALQLGDRDVAFAALRDVHASLQAVFGDTEGARKARSLWFSESNKEFKGEPYERAMVGYYLGLEYLRRRDYGNAQAAFRFGAMQDAIAEEAQHASDFALLYYLQALALLLQDPSTVAAQHPLAELARLRPDMVPPDPRKNVLVLIETGKAPRKVTDGIGHAELRYFRGRGFRENGATLRLEGNPIAVYPVEDIYWQAATRGGRMVDRINRGKLEFRNRMEDVGTVLTAASIAVVNLGEGDAVTITGAATAIGGSAALIAAANADAQADDRYWDNLPDAVHLVQLELPAGRYDAEVVFTASTDPGAAPPPRNIQFDVSDDGLTVVWVRSRQQFSGDSR